MTQQTINVGSAINDGTGDPARTAFTKSNNNFTELYARGAVTRIAIVGFVSNATWTKNANLIGVVVEVWGGGGGGYTVGSWGGGGGGYALKWYPASALASTVTITIGAGGIGSNTLPTSGGTTIFAAAAATGATGGLAATSGGGNGFGGDINLTGQSGNIGTAGATVGPGGNAPKMSGAGLAGNSPSDGVFASGGGGSSAAGQGGSGFCIVTEYYSA